MPSTEISPLARKYSGIVFNQNQTPSPTDFISVADDLWRFQDLFLPESYARGVEGDRFVPDLSGFHLCVGVDEGYADTAALDWKLEYNVFGLGWIPLAEGTAIGAPFDGDRVWMEVFFKEPVEVTETILNSRLRIGFKMPSLQGGELKTPIDFDLPSKSVVVDSQRYSDVILADDVITPLVVEGKPGFVTYDSQTGTACFSYQQGINKLWFSSPNPLENSGFCRLYASDGTTPIQENVSVLFRVLALCADSGQDIFGNPYRSVLQSLPASNIAAESGSNSQWLSKPNPSRFAVEAMHFDMRDNIGNAVTIDGIVVDPTTPGMWMNVYYSDDGEPGRSEAEWDQKLWTRVQKNWKLDRRQECVLPDPVVAKYVKIEFTHLQARHYSPGRFARPVVYRKHPKWVLDYFLVRLADQNEQVNKNVSNSVKVVYNALDLAYNYYLDDIHELPDKPVEADPDFQSVITSFVSERSDLSDQMDYQMLDRISFSMAPYRSDLLNRAKSDSLLTTVLSASASEGITSAQEGAPVTPMNQAALESLAGQAVAYENDYPVMYFYLPCRHAYREVMAPFDYDKAYFAGIREISFVRDTYGVQRDSESYVELGGDTINTERNDFSTGNLGRAGRSIGDLGVDYFNTPDGKYPAGYTTDSDF